MLSIALTLALLAPPSDPRPPVEDPGYVLHEWGTFTTLAGASGVLLEGLTYDDHQLPDFVYRRGALPPGFGGLRCKMETPVLYFYSDRERELRVAVGFQQGLMTQWYPMVAELVPSVGSEEVVRGGILDWGRVIVLAPGQGLRNLPDVGSARHWEHAREVDANVVAGGPGAGEHGERGELERFLFYRGLGDFSMPLGLTLSDAGVLSLWNGGENLDDLIVLERRGARLTGRRLGSLPARQSLALDTRTLPTLATEQLMEATCAMLEEQGLYPKEARAMVATWRESYFESDGLRVLYPLPRATTDWILPLRVTPAPSESVRVLVGRTDVLSLDEERAAVAVLPSLHSAEEARARLGRFALPILRYLNARSDLGEHARELQALLEREP